MAKRSSTRKMRKLLQDPPVTAARRSLLSSVYGDVIELYARDGRSLPYYPVGQLRSLTLVDRRFSKSIYKKDFGKLPVTLLQRLPETLPFDDCSFDCACLFFALSSTTEPYRVLSELRRTLRPGGRLLFIEYARPSGPAALLFNGINTLQRIVATRSVNRGRNTLTVLEVAGFRVSKVGVLGGRLLYGEAAKP